MGEVKVPLPVKLIVGIIFKDEYIVRKGEKVLSQKFGIVDFESEIIPFIHTNYYEKEIGENLKRKFISFQKLISPGDIPKIKLFTNSIEKKLSWQRKRQINLDPGYLSSAKLVLATTKDYAQRIYLEKGIYGEATLYYKENDFHPYEWTYPDYKTHQYQEIFHCIRKIYLKQLSLRAK